MNTGLKTETLKKWLRRLIAIGVIGLIIIILASAEIGIVSFKAGSAVKKDLISVKDVTQALEHAGLTLTTNLKVNKTKFALVLYKPWSQP